MRSILEILSDGQYVSGEEISREMGISRAAVWKRIGVLKEQGWQIESGGKRGYRLESGDSLAPELWKGKLTTRYMGQGENRYLAETDSTNVQVKQMAIAGAPGGSLCVAECQTAGKGRLGRQWISPAGQGLWISLLLRPHLTPSHAPLITLCTAMAMSRAVQEVTGADCAIKWPNDLVHNGKKICGILLEMGADPDAIEYVVVGTGLNVKKGAYPPELAERAIAIEEFAPVPKRRDLIVHYLTAMEALMDKLEEGGFEAIMDTYRANSCTLGSRVHVSGSVDFVGVAESIDETGALLVRDDEGQLRRVLSGDVSVRGVMGYV